MQRLSPALGDASIMQEQENGSYVRYEDAQAEIARLHARIEEMSELCLTNAEILEIKRSLIIELISKETSVIRLHNGTTRSVIFCQDASKFAKEIPLC